MVPVITALIPAYEPSDILLSIVKELYEKNVSVVIVNDGSSVLYQSLFQKLAPYSLILNHSQNKGKGEALKTGLAYIQQYLLATTVIVTADADGQHSVQDIMKVAMTAHEHSDSLVLGVRQFHAGVPFRSRFGNIMTRSIFLLSTGVTLSDTQTGLRAFSNEFIAQMLNIPGARYEYEMNVLLIFAKHKVKILEKNIETIYYNKNTASHFKAVRDSLLIYQKIIKFASSSFICFLIDYLLYAFFLVLLPRSGLSLLSATIFANILARIFSASVNYTINRNIVFHANTHPMKSAVSYFTLAIGILIGNLFLLSFLTGSLHISPYLAKIITELTFFTCSFLVQHFFIFRKKNDAI